MHPERESLLVTSNENSINNRRNNTHQRQIQYGATTNRTNDVVNGNGNGSNNNNGGGISDNNIVLLLSDTIIDQKRSTLSLGNKIGYSLGHIYNDLCAGVWFSYTLLFMQGALRISASIAGTLVMLGQIGDALATPIVGALADKYGSKRKWHILGTGLVFITFPLIFSICPWCSIAPNWWQIVYFSVTILLFQFGWAIVQISHLAMIPEFSRTQKDRVDLTAIRYSSSVCANVTVYIVTWAVLHVRSKTDNTIGPADAYRFRDISLILTLVGISMSVIFHFSLSVNGYENRRRILIGGRGGAGVTDGSNIGTPATGTVSSSTSRGTNSGLEVLSSTNGPTDVENLLSKENIRNEKKNFFKSPLLYQNAFLYVFSRLFMTTSLVYMPLWLDERSWIPANVNIDDIQMKTTFGDSSGNVEHIATVPLMSFLASFIASTMLKYTNRLMGHQLEYTIGSLTSIIGCIWVAFAAPVTASTIHLFGIAILFGIGSSVTMISSLCITADMIGIHVDQGGFIYSAVTFADKLITGIVVIIIESIKCNKRSDCPDYYKNVLAYGCGTAAIMGLLTLSTIFLSNLKHNIGDGSNSVAASTATIGINNDTTSAAINPNRSNNLNA